MPTILTQVPGVADRDDSSFGTWVEDDRPSMPPGYFKEVGREGEALGQSPSSEGVTVDSEAPPDLRGGGGWAASTQLIACVLRMVVQHCTQVHIIPS